jgi:hypothetical protein
MNRHLAISTKDNNQESYQRIINLPFGSAIERTKDALEAHGFGVVCEIDLGHQLKCRYNIDSYRYMILGDRNTAPRPEGEPEWGFSLLHHVLVYERGGYTIISAVDLDKMFSIGGNDPFEMEMNKVGENLQRAINMI